MRRTSPSHVRRGIKEPSERASTTGSDISQTPRNTTLSEQRTVRSSARTFIRPAGHTPQPRGDPQSRYGTIGPDRLSHGTAPILPPKDPALQPRHDPREEFRRTPGSPGYRKGRLRVPSAAGLSRCGAPRQRDGVGGTRSEGRCSLPLYRRRLVWNDANDHDETVMGRTSPGHVDRGIQDPSGTGLHDRSRYQPDDRRAAYDSISSKALRARPLAARLSHGTVPLLSTGSGASATPRS
ncbi:hypothetical protein HNR56_002510 [Roseospira marina]|nr:hypothetical protein [Roseospira marina]MBB5087810.1 hypothetical protein [Roseospira marina]